MNEKKERLIILYADDDRDDQLLMKEALEENYFPHDMRVVADGEELMDYLNRRGAYTDPRASPRPDLILLDLNMPKKTGAEALAEIKGHQSLRRIPVVVITTSKAEEDVCQTYDLGVNSFISKPFTFEGTSDVVKILGSYWFNLVELPPAVERRNGREPSGGLADR